MAVNTKNGPLQLRIFLQKTDISASRTHRDSTITAFAGVMGIATEDVELYEVDDSGCIFNLGIPAPAMPRLRSGVQSNSGQLRLLGVEKVIIERELGVFETWAIHNGAYELEMTFDRNALETSLKSFVPLPGIWRFHFTYLIVTLVMGLSAFPYSQFVSILLISAVCAFGIILAFTKYSMAAHILALVIGLGSPVVVLVGLLPVQTVLLFLFLIFGAALARRFLF